MPNTSTSASVKYHLKTAFDYEIKNYIDIKILQITSNVEEDLCEEDSDELRKLTVIKEYLLERTGQLKV